MKSSNKLRDVNVASKEICFYIRFKCFIKDDYNNVSLIISKKTRRTCVNLKTL